MDVPRGSWVPHRGALVWYGSTRTMRGLVEALRRGRNETPQFIYLNSIFNFRFSILPLMLNKVGFWRGAQVFVAPRGESDPGALASKSLKKQSFLTLSRVLRLYQGVIWHASSPLEASNIAALRLDKAPPRILVKENETHLPTTAVETPAPVLAEVTLVCSGRVSPKKNLEVLIDALSAVGPRFHLHIAGSIDDDRYFRDVKNRAADLSGQVTWHGHLQEEELFALLDQCDAACFPTKGENFSHAIAEALSRGLPVLVADVTPWTSVIMGGGGILVESSTASSWADALVALSTELDRDAGELRRRACAAYNRWARETDQTSFLDYVMQERTHEITWTLR